MIQLTWLFATIATLTRLVDKFFTLTRKQEKLYSEAVTTRLLFFIDLFEGHVFGKSSKAGIHKLRRDMGEVIRHEYRFTEFHANVKEQQ